MLALIWGDLAACAGWMRILACLPPQVLGHHVVMLPGLHAARPQVYVVSSLSYLGLLQWSIGEWSVICAHMCQCMFMRLHLRTDFSPRMFGA